MTRTVTVSALACDECGKFIPWRDLYQGEATRRLLTPSSHFTCEEYETLCRRHATAKSVFLRKTEQLWDEVAGEECERALKEALEVDGGSFALHGGLV